eukprot:1159878-Pelagomonas_calceolata.AAC.18
MVWNTSGLFYTPPGSSVTAVFHELLFWRCYAQSQALKEYVAPTSKQSWHWFFLLENVHFKHEFFTITNWHAPAPAPRGKREGIQLITHTCVPSFFREQGDAVMRDLPLEANLGLFSVDCRALQQRLADRAAGLVVTVLMTVQHDLEETSSNIIEKLM